MTLQDALKRTMARLKHAGLPEARLEAEYLVAAAASIPRLQLALCGSKTLSPDGEQRLAEWVHQRLERCPLAYVLEEQPFMNLTMRVTPAVLIPRPETELLVEEAYRLLDTMTSPVAADIGTGSGNIALSLAQHPWVSEVHAVDISFAALEIAQENFFRNDIKKSIHWHLGDLLTPLIEDRLKMDLIVANLPYVATGEMSQLAPEVRWEPSLALDGGRDGLAYIYQLVEQAERVLKPEGTLLLEIGCDQGPAVLDLVKPGGVWQDAQLYNDLAGLPRIVRAQKGPAADRLVTAGSAGKKTANRSTRWTS